MPNTEVRYQIGIKLREYLSDVCKCVNLSEQVYKRPNGDKLVLQSGLVETLGDLRLLTAELLFEICQVDIFSQGESFNLIHDSTFHILAIWAMKKSHNNIFLVKYTAFFTQFCQRATDCSLINAFLKTNLIADLANFFMDNIFGVSEVSKQKDNFLCFFYDIVTAIQLARQRPECPGLASELKKSMNWKYLVEVLK